MKKIFVDIFKVWRNEFSVVYADMGVMIFLFLLPLAYPLVYSSIYNPEVIRDVPVVVVDDSRTYLTRKYVRHLDATPDIKVIGYASDMKEAERAMAEKDCYGVIHFPSDFSRKVGRNEEAIVEVYCDMSLLLRYRSVLIAATAVASEMGEGVQVQRLSQLLEGQSEMGMGKPIPFKLEPIGNLSQGLASAIMPGVLVLILQQCLILAICFLGATSRRRAKLNGGIDLLEERGVGVVSCVLGKMLCYFVLMLIPVIFVVHFVPIIFDFPINASVIDLVIFFVPYLLAVIMFGMMVQRFVPDRESTFLVVVFTSVAFVFLSGISWPRYAMSVFWQFVGACIPSTWGVTGFVGMNTVGATLAEQRESYMMLWVLAVVYFLVNLIFERVRRNKIR